MNVRGVRDYEYYRTSGAVLGGGESRVVLITSDQWQLFEPWLGPLKDALGDALSCYRQGGRNETGSQRSVPLR
jgi:hypothetical protein